jgi:hypothetical protein
VTNTILQSKVTTAQMEKRRDIIFCPDFMHKIFPASSFYKEIK